MLSQNYKPCDESKNFVPYDYTMNVFKSARQNSLIISTQWDFWLASAWYFQFIKGMRSDINIIDKELLRRSWYIRHIRVHYPEIYNRSSSEFEIYLNELMKFENETPRYLKPQNELDKQDLVKINNAFINLLNSLVDKNYNDKYIYTTMEIEQNTQEKFGKEYLRIPEGLLLRYSKEKTFDSTYIDPDFKFEVVKSDDYYFAFIMKAYYDTYVNRANYLMNFSKFEKAEELLKKAIDINSQKQEAKNLLKKISELKAVQK
jgi:tetratricopeptide (TPR) repeat protein